MKTSILSFILFCIGVLSVQAQVGVNTENPTEGLDIQGSLQVRKEIRVGPSATGDPGTVGQILISKGNNAPPAWFSFPPTKKRLAQVLTKKMDENSGYVFGPIRQYGVTDISNPKNMFIDNGSELGSNEPAHIPVELEKGAPLVSPWKHLEGLDTDIIIGKAGSLLGINLQTTVQTTAMKPVLATVSVGIFLDNQLEIVRSLTITGAAQSFELLTLDDVIEELSPKYEADGTTPKAYELKVAVRLRHFYGIEVRENSTNNIFGSTRRDGYILVGRGINALSQKPIVINGVAQRESAVSDPNTNDFMNRTSFVVNVYEPTEF